MIKKIETFQVKITPGGDIGDGHVDFFIDQLGKIFLKIIYPYDYLGKTIIESTIFDINDILYEPFKKYVLYEEWENYKTYDYHEYLGNFILSIERNRKLEKLIL